MTHRIGDLVILSELYARPKDRGVVYRVQDVLKVNIVVEPVNGGRKVRGRPELFEAAPSGTEARVVGIPYVAPLDCGQVVTIAGTTWRQPADQLWVVLNDGANGKVKVAKLGGDGGRYWNVPRGMLTVTDKWIYLVKN